METELLKVGDDFQGRSVVDAVGFCCGALDELRQHEVFGKLNITHKFR